MTTFAIYHIGPLRSNVLSNTSALNFIQIADCRDPQMSSKSRILYVFLQQLMLGPHSGAMLFCFVRTPLI